MHIRLMRDDTFAKGNMYLNVIQLALVIQLLFSTFMHQTTELEKIMALNR